MVVFGGRSHPCKHKNWTQCWFNVGPASSTLSQHWTLGPFLVFAGTPIRVAMGSCRWGEEAGVRGSGINSCRDHMSGVPPLTHRRLGTKGRYLPVYWVTHTFISFPGDTGYPCVCSSVSCPGGNTLLWGNKAVSGCFSSKKLLPFAFLYTAE